MVALPLFDIVLSSDQTPERASLVAEQLMQAALSDLERIEKLDKSLSPADPRQFERQTAALIRGLYEDWASQCEALMERVARVETRNGQLEASNTLRDAHGRVRAMLSISLERIERSRKQLAEGKTIPVAEVRRELRLGVR